MFHLLHPTVTFRHCSIVSPLFSSDSSRDRGELCPQVRDVCALLPLFAPVSPETPRHRTYAVLWKQHAETFVPLRDHAEEPGAGHGAALARSHSFPPSGKVSEDSPDHTLNQSTWQHKLLPGFVPYPNLVVVPYASLRCDVRGHCTTEGIGERLL
eukprot:116512-Rhodomonas_salina.1